MQNTQTAASSERELQLDREIINPMQASSPNQTLFGLKHGATLICKEKIL